MNQANYVYYPNAVYNKRNGVYFSTLKELFAYAKEDGFTFMRKKGESEEACFYNDFEVIGKGEVL